MERDVLAVEPAVRRVVGARLRDAHLVEDLVQETLVRVLEARPRLAQRALLPYAVVTARNLVVSHLRDEDRSRRHQHRLIDLRPPAGPDEEVLRREEAAAVTTALARLDDDERATFVAHSISGATTAQLAEDRGSTPGGVAVALARTRAKLRVDYVLALRQTQLPTARCRSVLVALSAADTRRQLALDAGGHLLACPVCAALSEPLTERRRAIAVLAPVAALPARTWRRAREQPVAAVVLLVALLALGLYLWPPPARMAATAVGEARPAVPALRQLQAADTADTASTADAADRRLLVDGAPLRHPWGARLREAVDGAARGRDLVVQAVVADEGFWVAAEGADRLWIRLVGDGESPTKVEPGQLIRVDGRVVAHTPGFAQSQGVTAEEGAAELDAQGAHLEVRSEDLTAR